jgi:7-carboxy-7-deazaguanine synthase
MNPARDSTLLISEVFGPTIQGEGPSAGQRAIFVRTAGCPVGCSWCVNKFSWDAAAREGTQHEIRRMPVKLLARCIDRLSRRTSDLVVITGGEPLAQADAVLNLASQPTLRHRRLHLETAGVHIPAPDFAEYFELMVVSPKLANSGVAVGRRINGVALTAFNEYGAWFKFVVRDLADLNEISKLEQTYGLERIMVMPEGRDAATITTRARQIGDLAIARGWSLSSRLHILLWGDAPGR